MKIGVFVWPDLGAGDAGSGGTFFTFGDLEGDGVADLEFIERHADELLGVEEEILRLAFAGDESESSVCERLDCSGHSVLQVYRFL